MTAANAKICPFEDKMLHSKKSWDLHIQPRLGNTPQTCPLILWVWLWGRFPQSLTLPMSLFYRAACQNAARSEACVSGLFKWLILDEPSCHLFTRHERPSLIKTYRSLYLFPAIKKKKTLINEIARWAINNTQPKRVQKLSGAHASHFLNP